MMNSSIWFINRTLTGTATPGQSELDIYIDESDLCLYLYYTHKILTVVVFSVL